MYITLGLCKQHLLIDEDFTDDDNYILLLIQAAEDAVAHHLNYPLEKLVRNGELPSSIIQAILLLIGNFYNNREPVSYGTVLKVPYTIDYLLGHYKHYNKP